MHYMVITCRYMLALYMQLHALCDSKTHFAWWALSKTIKFFKRILRFNSVLERRHLKIPQVQIETIQIQPIEFRNAEFGPKMCLVWAYAKHSWAIYLQIMKTFSICTPPMKFWERFLRQQSCCGSQTHFISNKVLWIISKVDSGGAVSS